MTTELIPVTPCHPRKWHIQNTVFRKVPSHTLCFLNHRMQTVPGDCLTILMQIVDALNAQPLPQSDTPEWTIQIQRSTGRIRIAWCPSGHEPAAKAIKWESLRYLPSFARQVSHLNTRLMRWRDRVECAADASDPATYLAHA